MGSYMRGNSIFNQKKNSIIALLLMLIMTATGCAATEAAEVAAPEVVFEPASIEDLDLEEPEQKPEVAAAEIVRGIPS
jgi:PBP1b-binding outer membrane lipoprotein LpoB